MYIPAIFGRNNYCFISPLFSVERDTSAEVGAWRTTVSRQLDGTLPFDWHTEGHDLGEVDLR